VVVILSIVLLLEVIESSVLVAVVGILTVVLVVLEVVA
jgi:hypothetical protein